MLTDRRRMTRRTLLTSAAALAAMAGVGLPGMALAAPAMPVGTAFSFDLLSEWARARAGEPYAEPARPEGFLGALTYDDYRSIRFKPENARWSEPGDAFRLHAFHTGWLFGEPVQMFDVSAGTVQPLEFTTADFTYDNGLSERVPADEALPGVAGFRLHYPLNRPDIFDELVAFLGASYFRALGQGSAYGLSARGLALNTGTGTPEEFPRFTAFYLERPAPGADHCILSAALDSPSVTGAYRFVIRPGEDTRMEVTARLYFRADVEQVGIAPLTSMFLYDDKNRARFDDYRPRVHDSNGLRMIRPDGDVLWRPLNNPLNLADSWFAQTGGRFGLHQRGRDFADYQDAEAHYERRPSLDVEPVGDWGPGAVRLVEIPTDLEVNDNIVAFWVAEGRGAKAGEAREYSYILHWGNLTEADPERLAEVVATRAGVAGVSGVENPEDARKFVVDFAGPLLANLPGDAALTPVVTLSAGEIIAQTLEPVPEDGVWRLVLDVAAPEAAVIELTAHLAGYGRKLTETWLYQWIHA
jgi:glucans biosynthesis protein